MAMGRPAIRRSSRGVRSSSEPAPRVARPRAGDAGDGRFLPSRVNPWVFGENDMIFLQFNICLTMICGFVREELGFRQQLKILRFFKYNLFWCVFKWDMTWWLLGFEGIELSYSAGRWGGSGSSRNDHCKGIWLANFTWLAIWLYLVMTNIAMERSTILNR